MPSQTYFNGQLLTTPQAVSSVDDSNFAPTQPTTGNVVCYLGDCAGGEPGIINTFGDPTVAAAKLVSGDLYTAAVKAFSASNVINAPSSVLTMRVGQATPATLDLSDGTNAVIEVVAANWGTAVPPPSVKVETGTLGGRKISVMSADGTVTYVGDNLGATNPLTVEYTGNAATATMAVIGTEVTITIAAAPVVNIDLTVNQTMAQLTNALNGIAGITATMTAGADQVNTVYGLDGLASESIKGATVPLTNVRAACVAWLDSAASPLTQANDLMVEVVWGGAGTTAFAPAPIDWTPLAGATAPVPVLQDYVNALALLQQQDVQFISCLTSDPAVAAALEAHCTFMSTNGKKERRGFTGPALGTSPSAAEALPGALDSDRIMLCYPGYADFDQNGNLVTLPSWQTAAMIAAMFAGGNPGDAMTNKQINVQGLEVILNNPTDTDAAIRAGLCVMEKRTTGYFCVRSISTWLINNAFDKVEYSTGIATDYGVRSVREDLQANIVGQRGDPRLLGRTLTRMDTVLRALAKPPPTGPGVIVGDSNSPPYRNLQADLDGDTITAKWQMSPVIPNNFVLCSVSIYPYSGTATLAAPGTSTTSVTGGAVLPSAA